MLQDCNEYFSAKVFGAMHACVVVHYHVHSGSATQTLVPSIQILMVT